MTNKLFKGVVVKTRRVAAAEGSLDTVTVEQVVFTTTSPILVADATKARDVTIAQALESKAVSAADLTNQVEPVEVVISTF